MEITPIRTEKDDRAALRVVSELVDQAGLSITGLEPMIGQPNRVYEVLSPKQPLTLDTLLPGDRRLG